MIGKKKKDILFFGNIIFNKYYLLLYIAILISLFKKYIFLDSLIFAHSITLLNGDIFIIHKDGIVVYDSSLNYIKYSFPISNLINSESILSKIEIESFSALDGGYIIGLIDKRIFFFDWEGHKIYESQEIGELVGDHYTLIPIKRNLNDYFYMIGFIENKKINLKFFIYNKDNNSTNINHTIGPLDFDSQYDILNTLSCQLMKDSNEESKIVCFFNYKDESNFTTTNFIINITDYNIYNSLEPRINMGMREIKVMKSVTNFEKNRTFICFSYPDGPSDCIIYSIKNNNFENKRQYNVECGDKFYKLKLQFVRETNHFLFFCQYSNFINLAILDYNLNNITNYKKDNFNYDSISIIYSYNLSNYHVIINNKDQLNEATYFQINLSIIINAITEKIDNLTDYINQELNKNQNSDIKSTIASYGPFLYTTVPISEKFISSSEPYEINTDIIIPSTYLYKVSKTTKESYISTILSSNLNTETTKESYISTILSSNPNVEPVKESYISTIFSSNPNVEPVKESYISTTTSSNPNVEPVKESYISTIFSSNTITEYIESNIISLR